MINIKEPELELEFVITASLQEAMYCNFGSSAQLHNIGLRNVESTRKTQILRDAGKILNTDRKYIILKMFDATTQIPENAWKFHLHRIVTTAWTVVCYGLEYRAAAFIAELDKEQNRQLTE